MNVSGIHHITAVSAQIEANLAFYTSTMGMRLVKKSVNQDDLTAYHLFYADAAGSPGTDLTFFDWPSMGPNQPGAASVSLTTLRVSAAALEFWEDRLTAAKLSPIRDEDLSGRARLQFTDPDGQRLAIVDDSNIPAHYSPWNAVIPTGNEIRGILGVDIESARPDSTRRVLTELLGYQDVDGRRFTTESSEVVVHEPAGRTFGHLGAGGIHHVAFRVRDDQELAAMQERIEATGIRTSGYVDRFYFHSLYFREPGGVLFELATDGPGMSSDEPGEHLGQRLALPPFLESRRSEIEANLKPLPSPAYSRPDAS